MTNIFITGGSGFLGSHLCERLSNSNHVITLVRDLSPPGSPWAKWLKVALANTTLVLGDIQNLPLLKRILADYQIEQVYHLAACATVGTAIKNPVGTFETNVMGAVNVLEACREIGTKKALVMSTDKVYGERTNALRVDPLVATGIYETSKACEDLVAQAFAKTYGLDITIARSCNAYGFDFSPRIVSNTIRSCLRGEPPIIYEGEKGQRQYVYVDDLCFALRMLMKDYPKGIYNIGTDDILGQGEVVREICRYFSLTPRLVKREIPIPEIEGQSLVCAGFNWAPHHTFSMGIQETIKKFQEYGWKWSTRD